MSDTASDKAQGGASRTTRRRPLCGLGGELRRRLRQIEAEREVLTMLIRRNEHDMAVYRSLLELEYQRVWEAFSEVLHVRR